MALDRHSIEKKDFPLGKRGYDPDAVDAHLSALADEVSAFKQEARRRSDNMAASASDRVRTIIEAAEHSASEINRSAEDDAREIREEAGSEANTTRENAHREAREYLEKVSASTNAMIDRLRAMEGEMNAMIETVRTGSNRLRTDLEMLQGGYNEVSGSLTPRPRFKPDEPAPVEASEEQTAGVQPPEFGAPAHVAEESAAETPASPEGAALESVAGEGGHDNGGEHGEAAQHGGDAESARLIALNMALNGTPREETARYLSENFQLADAHGLLDEVYASVES